MISSVIEWVISNSAGTMLWASLVAETVKNPPLMWETWVRSLVWKRSLGGGHVSSLQYCCLENPHGQRSLVGYSQSMRSQTVGHDWVTNHKEVHSMRKSIKFGSYYFPRASLVAQTVKLLPAMWETPNLEMFRALCQCSKKKKKMQ